VVVAFVLVSLEAQRHGRIFTVSGFFATAKMAHLRRDTTAPKPKMGHPIVVVSSDVRARLGV
jgi:hypothetical protein